MITGKILNCDYNYDYKVLIMIAILNIRVVATYEPKNLKKNFYVTVCNVESLILLSNHI